MSEILHLDDESSGSELALAKAADSTLRELKRLYDTAIKPLEILYKYRDLSNRHFGGKPDHDEFPFSIFDHNLFDYRSRNFLKAVDFIHGTMEWWKIINN